MHPVSCTNTHHNVTDTANINLKMQKLEYLKKGA